MKLITALLASPACLFTFAATAAALQTSTTRVSVSTSGAQVSGPSQNASISADGRCVAFQSSANNLVAGDTANLDVFVRDLTSGTTERVSVVTGGAQATGHSSYASISGDGRFVAFESNATNLVAGDANGLPDIFVHDRQNGTTECVSVTPGGVPGNYLSGAASISADGRFVVFVSLASDLVPADPSGNVSDVFLRDRQSGTTTLVSQAWNGSQLNPYSPEYSSAISADGRFVAYESVNPLLVAGDTNADRDIFVWDRISGTTERVSVATNGAEANSRCDEPSISADGRFIAFNTVSSTLVAGDTNAAEDIFVHDRLSGTTERVNVATGGGQSNSGSMHASLSSDGRFVAFQSYASVLVPGDTNNFYDIFVRDRSSATTHRVSVSSSGAQSNSNSHLPSISADGRAVAFDSFASTLVSGDTNGGRDAFVRDCGPLPSVYCTAGTTTNGCNASIFALLNPSVSLANACTITVANVEGQKLGLLFYGIDNAGFTPASWSAGSTSYLCVKPPTQRTAVQSSGGTANLCDGTLSLDWNAYQLANPAALGNPWLAGSRAYAQAWFRDPPAPKTTNLSDALELTYQP